MLQVVHVLFLDLLPRRFTTLNDCCQPQSEPVSSLVSHWCICFATADDMHRSPSLLGRYDPHQKHCISYSFALALCL